MNNILKDITSLQKTNVKKIIDTKIKEFESFKFSSNELLFQELCFCLMAANFNAEKSLNIQNILQNKLMLLSEDKLANKLKELGHRFPNTRAKYIVEARKNIDNLNNLYKIDNPRNWLVKNIKGLGLKEASHFLRNIGIFDYAIVDFHIVDLLVKSNLIIKPKTITPKIYLNVENILRNISKKINLSLGELDLYLWYIETGKVIK